MKGNFQKKFDSLKDKIAKLDVDFCDILSEQLKDAKTMKELELIEKTLFLAKQIKLEENLEEDSVSKNKKRELLDIDDPNNPVFIQVRFAMKKEDYIWRIKSSNLTRKEKEFLLSQIELIEKDNSIDHMEKWELLNSMKKYLPKQR